MGTGNDAVLDENIICLKKFTVKQFAVAVFCFVFAAEIGAVVSVVGVWLGCF